MPSDTMTAAFVDFSRRKLLQEYWPRLRATVDPMTDEQVWWRPHQSSNSVGNLILHLNGNVRQWLVTAFTRTPDARDRPAEFAERQSIPAAALLDALGLTIYHVVEHFGMHYGQIIYIAKLQRGADLGFYKELGKTGRTGSTGLTGNST